MGFFCLKLLPQGLFIRFFRFRDPLQPHLHLLRCQHDFRGRVQYHFFQLLYRPLALRIKAADGIHLIAPQLDPDRKLLRQRENIHNTATDGELSHTVYLCHALVA